MRGVARVLGLHENRSNFRTAFQTGGGLTEYSQVNSLVPWYDFVNLGMSRKQARAHQTVETKFRLSPPATHHHTSAGAGAAFQTGGLGGLTEAPRFEVPPCHPSSTKVYFHRISGDHFKPLALRWIAIFTMMALLDRLPKAMGASKRPQNLMGLACLVRPESFVFES